MEEPTRYGSDFVARTPPVNGILLSFHSVGNAINVWRIKETPIPYFYGIDRLGYSGWSELAVWPDLHGGRIDLQDDQESEAFCHELTNWLKANNLSKYRQSEDARVLPDQFVFFPMQVANDVVAKHNRLDPVAVLGKAAWSARRSGVPLVVKRHPYCRSWRVAGWLKWLATANRHVHVTNASVTRLLPACSGGFGRQLGCWAGSAGLWQAGLFVRGQ